MTELMNHNSAIAPATRILIVEDEQIIAMNLRESLELMGYVVPATISSAETAIDTAAKLLPDLVLMDICLKGNLDGIQAAERIWNQFQIPVIYVTGHSDPHTLERAKATAPFGYILKPIKEKELYIAIETALQRCTRERLLLSVFRGIGDAVVVTDTRGLVTFLNPMAEVLTEWTQEEAYNRSLGEVFRITGREGQPVTIDSLVKAVLEQAQPIYLEDHLTLISKQGKVVPIADSIASFRDNQGNVAGVVIVFRDITQRLLAEERDRAVERAEQLELQMVEMQRLNTLKEDFLSTVSHELRTPLSNIQLATRMLSIVLDQFGMLAKESGEKPTALSRYIDILQDQSDQELQLVNDLLDMQRITADSYPLDLSVVHLQDWLPHILEPFSARATMNQQRFKMEIPSSLPTIHTDTHILLRVISELLNNACKYTSPTGQVTVTVQVVSGEEFPEGRSMLVLEVCNSGVEISSVDQERIFEPFYRIPQQDRWAKGGTGLGLALVKKFVTYLGGSVGVSSAQGEVCFKVSLPIPSDA